MKHSLALLTDLYQLTMAYGYWKNGMADRQAVFHLFFRKKPFNGSFALAAGLETALEFIEKFRFDPSDLTYLETLCSEDGAPLFEKAFLDYLAKFTFACDIAAIPEGTPVFPYEPLLRVQGPILQAQILESPLLNIINFQSLIATKAARVCWAARPDPVIEFGMRRAQGIDGAISASRAAYIGGCQSTSHLLAGKLYGIPVKGTMAHSWVLAYKEEEEAFRAFAEAMPHNCIFLIDTYDSIQGAKKAVKVAQEMRAKGIAFQGVRLDSGDLAHLSIAIRQILDEGGFPKAKIMASNELDEYIISDLKHQGSKVNLWGVGTHLVTGKEQPALDGIYKLSAIQDSQGKWEYKLKISETSAKTTDPGILQVRRFYDGKKYCADMIYDIHENQEGARAIVDYSDLLNVRYLNQDLSYVDLLMPVMIKGIRSYARLSLSDIQQRSTEELDKFPAAMRRFLNPQPYTCGLEKSLHEKKMNMIEKLNRPLA